jgi:hypothetical protein
MRPLIISIGGAVLVAFCVTVYARPQLTEAPSPCSARGVEPCRPPLCTVSPGGTCVADKGAPIGRTPRVKIAASEETAKDNLHRDRRDEGQLVNTLRDIFEALHACWMPPPPEKSRPGMEYTIRFAFKANGELMAPVRVTYTTHGVPEEVRNAYHEAVEAAFRRCTPMHFSTGMAGAIAGRPLGFHIFDDRIMIEQFKNGDEGTNKDGPHSLSGEDEKPK